jgi:c-di-GMP-related signal transduction protein
VTTGTREATDADLFVARQPIFDTSLRVFAYELLFRSGPENYFSWNGDPRTPTSSVIAGSMMIAELTAGKPAFVNFGREALLGDLPYALRPSEVVVEVLETVTPDAPIVAACRRLSDAGYRIALDDFEDRDDYGPLIELADFVKVDVLATPRERLANLVTRVGGPKRPMLAEKVETREMYDDTAAQGYRYFQGYFFSRPKILTSKVVPAYRLNYLRLMQELNAPETDIRRLEGIVKQEVSLSVRFLRRVNSAAFGFRQTTDSVGHALVLLGEREIKMCATVWSLANLASNVPSELVVSSTLRGRLCETLGENRGIGRRSGELFLVGSFSMLDVILERPMEDIVGEVGVSTAVRDALLGRPNELRKVLDAVVAYERGDWQRSAALAAEVGIAPDELAQRYLKALEWTREIFMAAA